MGERKENPRVSTSHFVCSGSNQMGVNRPIPLTGMLSDESEYPRQEPGLKKLCER